MAPIQAQSVLVYDRISQNRRKTALLILIAVLSLVPFVAGISYFAAERFVPHQVRSTVLSPDDDIAFHRSIQELPFEYRADLEQHFRKQRKARIEAAALDDALRIRIMLVAAGGLVILLGLLFWGIASSPTAMLLTMCGARPATAAEGEARRLLENLSIGAGLPVPKLYVIDSNVPNAFAAGADPSKSVVAVTTGLLKLMDTRELEGVLAHEISHIGNRDTRLNTIVASIALFLRLPYLLRQRHLREKEQAPYHYQPARNTFRYYTLALIPVYIYIFFIAPLLAAVMRAAISRGREFLADADAALLTRYPEGLLRALAKIAGAGSIVSASNPVISHLYFANPSESTTLKLFTGNLLMTHPPIRDRITRLMEFNGGCVAASVIEAAIHAGQKYAKEHPPVENVGLPASVTQDELSVLTVGNPMGRVYRLLGKETMPVYDRANTVSSVLARVTPGSLLVVFDDPGPFRQVNTAGQTFGYMPRKVKLQPIDMLPAEVYDPATRKAMEEKLAQTDAPAPAAIAPAPAPSNGLGLTGKQLAYAAIFFAVIFGGILLALMKFAG